MPEGTNPHGNFGACETCRKVVPARHETRDGKVYIVKECPDCGTTEALISSRADRWQEKRDIWQYDPSKCSPCGMNCRTCGVNHHPQMVFLNVTNRCNMNCPICIATIPAMGYEFNPPLSYFEKVLDGLAQYDPKPTVQLFGGEATVRKDMFDIVEMCRARGLRVRVVTNGLRLADEDYCKRICDAKLPVLLALDGLDPVIYDKLRSNPGALAKKLKAFENLKRFSTRKNVIMCCVAQGINDKAMPGMLEFCHENRSFIDHLHLIPLTETWSEGEFSTDYATNIEDVERIMDEAIPDEKLEFIPAGLAVHLANSLKFFGLPRLTFGGAHPNCEAMTYLFSDGKRWHPVSTFYKRSLSEMGAEIVRRSKKIEPRLARLDDTRFFQRWRGRLLILRTFLPYWLRTVKADRLFRGWPPLTITRIAFGLIFGRKLKDLLRKHSPLDGMLGMLILPFEEYHSIESERLQNCPSAFAFLDPDTDRVQTIPVCSYSLYRDGLERKIAAKYPSKAAAASSS